MYDREASDGLPQRNLGARRLRVNPSATDAVRSKKACRVLRFSRSIEISALRRDDRRRG